MQTLNTKTAGVEIILKGHTARWTKQLALRGTARKYDDRGVCGSQRLVIASDVRTFTANVHKLFPGGKFVITSGTSCTTGKATMADRVIRVLSKPETPPKISTAEIGKLIGVNWRNAASRILTPEFFGSLEAVGWRHIKGSGRAPSCFERTAPDLAAAA